jgi:hypothetical protein
MGNPKDTNKYQDPDYNGANDYGFVYGPDEQARYGGGYTPLPHETYSNTDLGDKKTMEQFWGADGPTVFPGGADPENNSAINAATVKQLMDIIERENDSIVTQMAGLWDTFVSILTNYRTGIINETDKLAAGDGKGGGWPPSKSAAAAAFVQNVGKGTWSIQEWVDYGGKMSSSLKAVATKINEVKTEMKTRYQSWVTEHNGLQDTVNANIDALNKDKKGNWLTTFFGATTWADGNTLNNFKNQLLQTDQKAVKDLQNSLKKLGSTYADAWSNIAGEPRRFQGPTQAQNPLAAYGRRMGDLARAAAAQARAQAAQARAAAQAKMNALHQQQLQMQQKQHQMQALMQQKQQQLQKQLKEQMQQEQQQLQQKEKQLQQQLQQQQKQLADAKIAAQQALATEQAAAAQAASQLAAAQAAMRQRMAGLNSQIAAGQAALNGQSGVQIPNATKFSQTGFPGSKGANIPEAENLSNLAGRAGLPNGGTSGFGRPSLNGRGMSGMSGLSGMGEMEGMGGRPPTNPGMRGRPGMGMPGGEGEEGAPGSRSPMGGRGDKKGGPGTGAQKLPQVNMPESEEYLTDMPTAPELLAGRLGGSPPVESAFTPPRPGLPGKLDGSGPGGPGRPMMPGAPRGNRKLTPEELAGRRKRIADAEEEDALLSPALLLRPDLTGRNGMPDIDWAQIRSGELDADPEMLGVRAKPAPASTEVDMPSRLAAKRRKDGKDAAAERKAEDTQETALRESLDELWSVQTPEVIEAPTERKEEQQQQQDQRGRALGTG